MSTFERRVAALEAVAQQKQVRVVFAQKDETNDEAIARAGIDAAARGVLAVRWG